MRTIIINRIRNNSVSCIAFTPFQTNYAFLRGCQQNRLPLTVASRKICHVKYIIFEGLIQYVQIVLYRVVE